MITELLSVIAPIFVCIGIGIFWGRSSHAYPADFITRMVMNIGAPCLVVSVLGKADIELQLLQKVSLAAFTVFTFSAIVISVILYYSRQTIRQILPPLLFGNNGNMGLPLALFAFGQSGLALALGYFWTLAMLNFTLGIAMLTWGGNLLKSLLNMFKQPLVYSSVVVLMLFATDSTLPLGLQNTVDLLAGMTIPLMLITLGVSLTQLSIADVKGSFFLGLLRLTVGFTIGYLTAKALDLEGILKGVVILQASMPAAVSNYLLALKYTEKPEKVAGIVVLSTIMSLATLPILISFITP
ncbi:AEC family transporter [Aestuariibacter sp. GS-14]|uniref:AEC family transporter n=1 Tax=Aestuariibacter sp. GS-14 TaxID=2590670 RepID=UPI00112682B3|nr:AEC family transporter [Aestuariibacter sp. GS-14]TPV61800.1 AEC family transporter [Aestuariibacter sp. GS-14]